MNEDLNIQSNTKRNQYLRDLILEAQLAYENTSKTLVNSFGQEVSEIDYFFHNLKQGDHSKKSVNDTKSTRKHL